MFTKLKNRWNDVTYSNDSPKIFAKNWFQSILFIFAIVAIPCIIGFISYIFDLDIDYIWSMFVFGGITFVLGCSRGYKNCEKDYQESERLERKIEEYKKSQN